MIDFIPKLNTDTGRWYILQVTKIKRNWWFGHKIVSEPICQWQTWWDDGLIRYGNHYIRYFTSKKESEEYINKYLI